jgi:hypothetical protein
VSDSVRPPYGVHFGDASYEVCDCCGFEFGNDDEPGTGEPTSFKDYLADWISDGMNWFEPRSKPLLWSLDDQLSHAGISRPKRASS